jgi:hypothetical protein
VIVSTFGPEGPTKCSGLDVIRYDAESLHREFGVHFQALRNYAVWDNPAVSLLLLQGRISRSLAPHWPTGPRPHFANIHSSWQSRD